MIRRSHFLKALLLTYAERLVLYIVLLTDTLFLSRVSDAAVAGVSVAVPVIYTLVAILGSIAGSAASFIGQYEGAGLRLESNAALVASISTGVGIGSLLAVLEVILSVPIPRLAGLSGAEAAACSQYLRWMCPMLITDGIFLTFANALSVFRLNKWALVASGTLATCNILANLALVEHLIPGLDISVAAIATVTVLSQIPAILIMAVAVYRHLDLSLEMWKRLKSVVPAVSRRIVANAGPSLVLPIIANAANLALARYYGSISPAALAAWGYARSLMIPVTTTGIGAFVLTLQSTVSWHQGAGNWDNVLRYVNRGIGILPTGVIVGGAALDVTLTAFDIWPTSQMPVVRLITVLLPVLIVSEAVRSVSALLLPLLRGAGDTKTPAAIAVFSQSFLVICGGWVGTRMYPDAVEPILGATVLAEVVTSAFIWLRWRGSAFRRSRVIQEGAACDG